MATTIKLELLLHRYSLLHFDVQNVRAERRKKKTLFELLNLNLDCTSGIQENIFRSREINKYPVI